MALSCADLRRLIDAEASLNTAEVRRHLEGCADCRAAVRRWGQVEAKLREWRDEEAPAFLHARLMAHVRAAGPERVPGWRVLRRLWWAPTLATALLVAIVAVRAPTRPSPSPETLPVRGSATPPSTLPSARHSSSAAGGRLATDAAPQPRLPAQAAHPAASPGAAPVAPGPLRGAAPSSHAEKALFCELIGPEAGGTPRRVALAESWAPAPGVTWTVVVEPSGAVGPEKTGALESGGVAPSVPLETLEALATLNLPPGRYVLRRTAD